MTEFTETEINDIYTELAQLSVPLDPDPVAFGPKRLNAKTAEVRRMLDRVHRIYLDLSQRLGAAKRALRRAQADLDLARKSLFANDPETRAGRSVSDRDAIAAMKLRTEIGETGDLEILVTDLEAVLTVVKAKHADLKDTEGRLRDQIRLCSEELGLGGRWGSAVPHAPEIDRKQATGADVDAVDKLLAGVQSEIHLAQKTGDFPAEHVSLFEHPVEETPIDQVPPDPVQENEPMQEESILGLTEALPAQVDQKDVDAFLDRSSSLGKAKSKPAKKVQVESSLDEIDDLLSSFEDPNAV